MNNDKHALFSLYNLIATKYESSGPTTPLAECITVLSNLLGVPAPPPTEMLRDLANARLREQAARTLGKVFSQWDGTEKDAWTGTTARNTPERRELVYQLLGLTPEAQDQYEAFVPLAHVPSQIIISNPKSHGIGWYTSRSIRKRPTWDRYAERLVQRGWKPVSIASLDNATTDILGHLADPYTLDSGQKKGLVVGYVQSGKTANFAGVIAKAVDAGYRLVIVLTGMTEILRVQTQGRLDKEVFHLDTSTGFPLDVTRPLTTVRQDYDSLNAGLQVLNFFEGQDFGRDAGGYQEALENEPVRYLVVKKNKDVLGKLLADLRQVANARPESYAFLPTLVIDDESDQASINTSNPDHKGDEGYPDRTKINHMIVEILRTLPKAQYVGYTATPFANVFIDPDDAEDLYPRDFIISLGRPEGYMGVSDFYDDREYDEGDYRSNKNSFVRQVHSAKSDENKLREAVDAFVLAGMIKLYRESHTDAIFKHHTMLVHRSHLTERHSEDKRHLEDIIDSSGYVDGSCHDRLKELFHRDFLPVSRAHPQSGMPSISSYEDVRPFLGECNKRFRSSPGHLLVVNGQEPDDTPDFDQSEVWSILIGGNKLSRGYTIEGLTVSYYRRRASTSDTLMQMGRWFGFRENYQDLVRLYIGVEEPASGDQTVDLYELFGAICEDEEMFRENLRKYSGPNSPEKITPLQIPPLVPSHLLAPVSGSKMFNARIQHQNFGGEYVESTMLPTGDSASENFRRFSGALGESIEHRGYVSFDVIGETGNLLESIPSLEVSAWHLQAEVVFELLHGFNWLNAEQPAIIRRVLRYLSRGVDHTQVSSWCVVTPLPKRRDKFSTVDIGGVRVPVRRRSRVATGDRYRALSEPHHRRVAEAVAYSHVPIALREKLKINTTYSPSTPFTESICRPRQGVILLYPTWDKHSHSLSTTEADIGLVLQFPPNSDSKVLAYAVENRSMPHQVVVNRPQ